MKKSISVKTVPADRFTPLVIFKKLGGKALLESAVLEIGKSRYSIILVEEAFRVLLDNRGVVRRDQDGSEQLLSSKPDDLLDILKKEGQDLLQEKDYGFPIPACGLGYLGYETAALFDKIPLKPQRDELKIPDAVFLFGSLFVIFDHYKDELKIAALDHGRQGKKAIERVVERLMDNDFRAYRSSDETFSCEGDIAAGRDEFIAGVKELKEHIIAGDIIQGVLSRRIRIATELSPLDAYSRLRRINPSPYLFYLDLDDVQLLGSSPELMVSLAGETSTIKPIAGTRPRGKNRKADLAYEQELLGDIKERAEHLMLVDLARNDLGRTARSGTVIPRSLYSIERYSHVMHIVSEIESELAPEHDVYDLIRTTFPAGTVSGAPKIKAMELVSKIEKVKRGPYAGLIGHFDINGDFDSCITIRSLIYKDGAYYLQAGAGIVYDSVPEKEFEETMHKARALISSLCMDVNEPPQGKKGRRS
ncbi:MAG: anthranilate synthase component I family protein [Candidatus Omnitrophota bacterium]